MRPRAAKLSPSCPKFLAMICLPKSVIYLNKLNVLSDVLMMFVTTWSLMLKSI